MFLIINAIFILLLCAVCALCARLRRALRAHAHWKQEACLAQERLAKTRAQLQDALQKYNGALDEVRQVQNELGQLRDEQSKIRRNMATEIRNLLHYNGTAEGQDEYEP